MIGDTAVPIEARKEWVWQEIARTHPEFKRENFPVDDPYMLAEIVVRNCCRYTPQPFDIVMDIGANIGIFSTLCGLHDCSVVAFEPNPAAFKVLKETLVRNKIYERVSPYNMAVWTHTGECSYHPSSTPPSGLEQTWISYNGAVNTPGADPEERVRCIEFADALGDQQWDCVKMDIEGAEFPLLMLTSDKALRQIKYLTLELHNGHVDQKLHDAFVSRLEKVFTLDGVRNGDRWDALFCTRR